MKLIRNALSFFLCAALLASSVFCVSAEEGELTTKEKLNYWENYARLINIIPEDCRPYYSDILNLERDDMAFMEITDIEQCSESNGIFVTLKGCPYEIIGVETPNGGFGYEERCNAFLRAMILDRKTGEPVAFDMFNDRSPSPYYSPGLMPIQLLGYRVFFETDNTAGSIKEARVFIELPDYFNNYDYKLVLFLYLFDTYLYRVEENGNEWLVQKDESITEPVEVDLSGTTLCMDANGDDIINISDVSVILKYIAGWKTKYFTFDSHRADVNHDGIINIEDAQIILKYLAEWDSEEATAGYYMDKYIKDYDDVYLKSLEEYCPKYCSKKLEEILDFLNNEQGSL